MLTKVAIIRNFLAHIKSKGIYLRTHDHLTDKLVTYKHDKEEELIKEFALDITLNDKDCFPKLFEAILTNIRNNSAHFSIVDENGFAGYQEVPVQTLLDKKIRCKVGTIFFLFLYKDEDKTRGEFIPWGEQSASKKFVDLIMGYNEKDLDGVYGWMADRLIEYGKFKDAETVIKRIGDAVEDYYKSRKEREKQILNDNNLKERLIIWKF